MNSWEGILETRKERINAQIKRNKKYHQRQKVKKFGKFSLFTGTTLGLSSIFSQTTNTNAVSSTANNQQAGSNQVTTNPAPSSSYNFVKAPSQVAYLTQSQYDFLNQIAPTAQKLAAENNLYASIMIAQAIIESGWGQSGLASAPNYNLFGVKGSYMGNSVSMPTFEQTPSGKSYSIIAAFAKYPNYEASMQGYIRTMLNPLYVGAWRSNTQSYQDAANYLTGRYATAINYGDTLISMIQKYNLNIFDSKNYNVNPQLKGVAFPTKNQTYIIQKGDSLWGISRKNKVSLNDILRLNNLHLNSKIYPNQILKLRETPVVSNIPNVNIVENQIPDSTNKPQLPLSVEKNPQVVQSELAQSYTVKAGDSLYAIAQKHDISLADLLELNHLSVKSTIKPGQVLKIAQTPKINSASTSPNLTDSTKSEYTVKKGDSLYRIAVNSGLSLADLLNLNNLKPDAKIVPGQKLMIKKSVSKSPSVKPPATANESEVAKYTVKAGDTLYHIAQQFGIGLNELLELNHLKPESKILPGQQLIVKKTAPVTAHPKPQEPVTAVSNPELPSPSHAERSTYTVKSGDSLYKIAHEAKISLAELLELNHLTEKSVIIPGQKLVIKESSKADKPNEIVQAVEANDNFETYEVAKGDTFYGIARKFGLKINELLSLNHLTLNSVVNSGTKLIVKKAPEKAPVASDKKPTVENKKETPKTTSEQTSQTVAPTHQKTYTVKQGDSLYKIATSHKTTVNALEKLNDLPGDVIIPGQVIRVE